MFRNADTVELFDAHIEFRKGFHHGVKAAVLLHFVDMLIDFKLFQNALYVGRKPVDIGFEVLGDMTVIKEAVARLEMGRNLVIYPEGTRSKDGKLGRGKTGVALIASLAQVPVIPMAISFKGEKLRFREKVIISFGKPIQPEELKLTSSDIRELKAIREKIMNSIAVMVDENVNKL